MDDQMAAGCNPASRQELGVVLEKVKLERVKMGSPPAEAALPSPCQVA